MSLNESRHTNLVCREWIYGRISEFLAIKLSLYSFVWKGFRLPVKSSQIMWNHTGECNCRQPYDKWSYCNPSSAAPFPSYPVSADTPGPWAANHVAEHRAIIRRAPCTPCHICPFGVRMIICKWQRAVAEVCYLKLGKKHFTSDAAASRHAQSPLFGFLLQIGPRIRGRGRKNKFQEKSIIKIPYPTPPCVANWYSAGSLAPLRRSNLQPGGREQRAVLSLQLGCAELRINR